MYYGSKYNTALFPGPIPSFSVLHVEFITLNLEIGLGDEAVIQ